MNEEHVSRITPFEKSESDRVEEMAFNLLQELIRKDGLRAATKSSARDCAEMARVIVQDSKK